MTREQFPDKKGRDVDFERVTDFLEEAQSIRNEFEIGQTEATWRPHSEYPSLPVALLLASDIHYGSMGVRYDLLKQHLDIVTDTPNFYLATNGDHVDFFNAIKFASGMEENPLPPQIQARTFMQKLREMDRKSKIAILSHGNHDDFGEEGGQDFYDSFLSEFQAPIFTAGGILNMVVGRHNYRMVMNHTYWGKSKINITNAPKRLLEYEGGGTCDIGWLGHTHQSSYEQFDKGPVQQTAIVSGTYKERDDWAAKRGIGGRGSSPGITLVLYPDGEKKRVQVFKNIEVAQQFMLGLIVMEEQGIVYDEGFQAFLETLDSK